MKAQINNVGTSNYAVGIFSFSFNVIRRNFCIFFIKNNNFSWKYFSINTLVCHILNVTQFIYLWVIDLIFYINAFIIKVFQV